MTHPSRLRRHQHSSPRALAAGLSALLTVLWLVSLATPAAAFCGFYVAKADTELYNKASKVVIVRDGDRTVLTMANDFRGDPTEFAMVVPVPTFLERNQIHVGDRAVIEHLDAYTAPRLVEYFDGDPCQRIYAERLRMADMVAEAAPTNLALGRAKKLGVSIEASYTVGEYDILILSAEDSRGLETWLRENGYRLPDGASRVLGSYLAQGMRFFVAKVNLESQSKLGFDYLRPLQMAFETPKFMLPLRLGTLNADGPQELFVWVLNREGRVETTNYRTVRLPSNVEIPGYVDQDFGDFYRALFDRQVEKERMRTVFLEYAWDMNWCDPCAADPLSPKELRDLGVFWIDDPGSDRQRRPSVAPPQARDVFVTRLHLRYTADTFPDDLRFHSTGNRENFQGRFVIHRPWTGEANACSEARTYFRELDRRRETWATNLAHLTGWSIGDIRAKMQWNGAPAEDDERPWWQKVWGDSGGR